MRSAEVCQWRGIEAFAGTSNVAKTYEHGIKDRTVVIEFDNLAQAMAAYDTPDYKEALRALGDGAERDLRIVEGV
jgi:uncharacterized protein (DUF1330 family)